MPLHDSVNLFGGFAPFPNTVMIPTMGLQSDVIGFRFGFGYEKGKRTLRAMSNEQFNSLNEEAEQAIYKEHDTTAINFFKQELQTWTALQHSIIEKTVIIEQMKASRTPSAMAEVIQALNTAIIAQGGTITWENLADTWNKFFGGGQIGTDVPSAPTPSAPTPSAPTTTGRRAPTPTTETFIPIPTPPVNIPILKTEVDNAKTEDGKTTLSPETMSALNVKNKHRLMLSAQKTLESTTKMENVYDSQLKKHVQQFTKKYRDNFAYFKATALNFSSAAAAHHAKYGQWIKS